MKSERREVLKANYKSDVTTQKSIPTLPNITLLELELELELEPEPEGHHEHEDEESKPNMMIATPNSSTEKLGMSSKDIVNIADEDDDDIELLYCHNKNSVISVESYSEDRDLQLAIMASLSFPTTPNRSKRRIIDLSQEPQINDDDVKVIASWTPSRKTRKPFTIVEKGESSHSNLNSSGDVIHTLTFVCEICVEPKSYNESFSIMGCTHSYCSDCVIKYVASKLQENITQIRCPVSDCKGLLEPEHCRPILPPEVFDRWGSALCEAVILGSEKFYCPYKDCSALLIDDPERGEVITQSECPNCYRLFCAQCMVAWHSGIECADFQKLNKDEREREDLMLMQLAKNKKWIRCPKCRFYVEKSQGCLFMRCRCGYTFCYNCGAYLISHFCSNCKH